MAKTANPADAFRKAQRKRELAKNKEGRKKVRDSQAVKKDTRELEIEIRELKNESKPNANSKARLADLESELDKINKVKEAYVAEHPEARDKVFRTYNSGPKKEQENLDARYDESGKLRDPTRSVYFDPVYNPFGVPPPGMPYKERTPEYVEENDSDEDEDEEDSDEEITLPAGPKPGEESGSDSDDSDEIPLPSGPPPRKAAPLPAVPPPLPLAGPPMSMGFPSQYPAYVPPSQPPFPPQQGFRPRPPPHHGPRPYWPPPTVQDPMSDTPTQTYQGYRAAKHELPARPGGPNADAGPSTTGGTDPRTNDSNLLPAKPKLDPNVGMISAAPVMRDLRKETTAFVPRGVKRKKGAGAVTVNAAPGGGQVDEDGDEVRIKRQDEGGGLMGRLKGVLAGNEDVSSVGKKNGGAAKDDYQKFLDGLDEL